MAEIQRTITTSVDSSAKGTSSNILKNRKFQMGAAGGALAATQLACSLTTPGAHPGETGAHPTATGTPNAEATSVEATKQEIEVQGTALVENQDFVAATSAAVQATQTKIAEPTSTLIPTATQTETPVAAAPTATPINTAAPAPTETSTPAVVATEAPFVGYPSEKALLDAAKNLSNKTHEDPNALYQEYIKIYEGMPQMDFVATSSEVGLMPNKDFHNITEQTYSTKTDANGYTFLSTSYADLDVDGNKFNFPWKKDDNRLIFVMGNENGAQKSVTVEKYPQGHGYTANAAPKDQFQVDHLKNSTKTVYDVWLADQIMQSIKGGSNQGIGVEQTVTVDFIDPKTNKVTEFVYDVKTKSWTKDGQAVAAKGNAVTPETVGPQTPVTEAQATEEAIKSLVRSGMTEADAKAYFDAIYGTMPGSMPFMADATKGLFPNSLNGGTIMTEPSHDPSNPSAVLNAAEHGFQSFSGDHVSAIVDGKWNLNLNYVDGTAYNVYFIGKTSDAGPADKNTNIGLYDYAAKYNFTVGASPDKGQEAQYDGRKVLDPVWVAEGVAQAHVANPNTKQVVEVFVDAETGRVTKFTYDLVNGKWLPPTTETMPAK